MKTSVIKNIKISKLPENRWGLSPLLTLDHAHHFAHFMCQMSEHLYFIYGYQLENTFIFKSSLESSLYCADCALDLNKISVKNAFQQDKQHDLAQYLAQLTQIQPEALMPLSIRMPADHSTLILILFSDKIHQIKPHLEQMLHYYLEQQQQLMVQNLELKQIKKRLEDLEEINLGRAKYFSVIAHDLRAPFHGILGCADILANERHTLDEGATQRLIEYLYDTTQSTYGLLENLLNWAMAEGGRFHQKPVHFRVNDAVQNIFDLLCAFAYKKQIKLQCDIAPNLFAYADVRMVTSILQNLMSNALKFTPSDEDKRIKISAYQQQQQIEIIIQDEGVGMTEAQIDKLFQEHTIPSTQGTSGEKGTGLGLVLCQKFLEMNGGSMLVESKLEEGTRFIVKLPLGNDHS